MPKASANKEFIKSVEAIKVPKLSEQVGDNNQSDEPSELALHFGLPPISQKPEAVPNLNFRKIQNIKDDSIDMGLLAKLDNNNSSPEGKYVFDNDITGSEGE